MVLLVELVLALTTLGTDEDAAIIVEDFMLLVAGWTVLMAELDLAVDVPIADVDVDVDFWAVDTLVDDVAFVVLVDDAAFVVLVDDVTLTELVDLAELDARELTARGTVKIPKFSFSPAEPWTMLDCFVEVVGFVTIVVFTVEVEEPFEVVPLVEVEIELDFTSKMR